MSDDKNELRNTIIKAIPLLIIGMLVFGSGRVYSDNYYTLKLIQFIGLCIGLSGVYFIVKVASD